ncbi:MAG: IS200/IS605 family element transposase accessory protein TnpB [Candidatus Lokiarchaeota archaeon]|nr:IS200/IS605 family element transposase accessory protein TnpB [Candidatus Lokiarchaeota archaeon]MBD3199957.1 IS200/IS605 family element transposase accessory protein TnpB [Candidatus Lokiarchaeota archaeon]
MRQCYFHRSTSDPNKKDRYSERVRSKFYKVIDGSDYSADKKKAAIDILRGFLKNGLLALRSTIPTVMKFTESFKDIGYTPCAQQIVLAVCGNFLSHQGLIKRYYKDLGKWEQTAESRRGPKPSRPNLPYYLGQKVKGGRTGGWKLVYPRQELGHSKNQKSLETANEYNHDTCSMYLPPSHDHLIPFIRVRTKVLRQLFENGGFVEIISKKSSYSFNIHYNKTKEQRAREYGLNLEKYEQSLGRSISIDFGVNNFLTVFNNFGARFPIFSGSTLKRWNYGINHRLPPLQRRVDVISDVLERYKENKFTQLLESIIKSRIHTHHDEFENFGRIVLYIFERVFGLSRMNNIGLSEGDFVLKCFHSKSFFRAIKNMNWDNFKKLAENDGIKVYKGIFSKVRNIVLMDHLYAHEKYSLLGEYFGYLERKRDYKVKDLRKISGYSVQRLQRFLESLELEIDELWDKYNRVKRDVLNKIAKKLMYYCLYYGVGTITIGYNKGWQSDTVKLKKVTRDLFVSLPFNRMFERIQEEALYFGITVDYTPEWYTSKCSYIDDEPIGKKRDGEYAGLRRFTQNKVKHNGLFRSGSGYIIHGDINGAANIGKKKHPELFSHNTIAYNLRLVSDPCQCLSDQAGQGVLEFITTPPIKFCPSNGIPTKELRRKEMLSRSKIKPQRYQMSPSEFLEMTQPACV